MSAVPALALLIAVGPSSVVEDDPPEPKSEALGIALPVVATFLPVLFGGGLVYRYDDDGELAGLFLLAFGLGVGPSIGHFYAGESLFAGLTSVLRTSLLGMGAFLIFADTLADNPDTAIPAAICGLVLWASAAYLLGRDLFDARAAVRRHNETAEVTAVLTPSAVVARDGTVGPALALAVRF